MVEPMFVTFQVTREGEPGRPMDHIIKRIDVDDEGAADPASLERLVESVRREVARKVARVSAPNPSAVDRG